MSIFKKASITPIVRTVVSQGLESQDKPAIMTQTEAMEHFMPKIMSHGKDYAKFTEIEVRKARPGELVETFTSDGKETQNTAGENDFVVKNLGGSGEEYILSADKLNKRYFNVQGNIWKAKGECKALEYSGEPMQFEASWGDAMVLKPGDMICSPLPDLNEVYRIARAEFFSTYSAKENKTAKKLFNTMRKIASVSAQLDMYGFEKEAICLDRILLRLAEGETKFFSTSIPLSELESELEKAKKDNNDYMIDLITRLLRDDFYKTEGHLEQDEHRFKIKNPRWYPGD